MAKDNRNIKKLSMQLVKVYIQRGILRKFFGKHSSKKKRFKKGGYNLTFSKQRIIHKILYGK